MYLQQSIKSNYVQKRKINRVHFHSPIIVNISQVNNNCFKSILVLERRRGAWLFFSCYTGCEPLEQHDSSSLIAGLFLQYNCQSSPQVSFSFSLMLDYDTTLYRIDICNVHWRIGSRSQVKSWNNLNTHYIYFLVRKMEETYMLFIYKSTY